MPKLGYIAAYVRQAVRDKLIDHKYYITEHGEDMPEIRNWTWKYSTSQLEYGGTTARD